MRLHRFCLQFGEHGAFHVLTAMYVPAEEARCSLRFSLGKWTVQQDIDQVLEVLPRIMTKLRVMSPLYKKLVKYK